MEMSLGSLGIWLACYLFAIASVDAAINDVCQTKEESLPGTCIPLLQCQRLYDLYNMQRPLPRATMQLLRAESCGEHLKTPLLCCRDETTATTTEPVRTTTEPVTTTTEPVTTTTVTSCGGASCHKNVGLINPELCGQRFSNRIVGGNKTGIFEMPWMALLKYRATRGKVTEELFKCVGSLINTRYVLTAAHCISNSTRLRLLSVRLGDHDMTSDEDCEDMSGTRVCAPAPQNINVESFIRHPSFNITTLVNDIGLIRLSVAADTNKATINPICLPVGIAAENKNLDNDKLIVAGWGITKRGSPSPDFLKVSLPVMPNERCSTVFQPFNYQVNSNQLCAGGTNLIQDSCKGDSGGPLMSYGEVNGEGRMVQYGVVSYGNKHCGTEGVPDVYTRIAPYMNWILDNMKP